MTATGPDDDLEFAGLDVGIERAYAPAVTLGGTASVLAALAREGGPYSPVLLADDPSPALPVAALKPRLEGRYRLSGEVGRGGVGVVLKGQDMDLGREVAVKMLQEGHSANPDAVRRFVEEAQIEGQLQHPGIVPIYEIGLTKDRRPFFSMKLVRGRTLADMLAARAAEGTPHRRFLQVFESVCQTMAYAHARGVIHRDLKPSNVMVGAFGEVLVVDWGMGKILRRPEPETAGADALAPAEEVPLTSLRSSDGAGASVTGSVLGTPRYMAPEQARGDVRHVDERADVFALGGLLCEILTGRPPWTATGVPEAVFTAARGDLSEAYARLEACTADPEFVALARDCLAARAEDRPRHAGEVQTRVAQALAAIDDRARRAETEAAEARVKVVEERRRRRLAVGLTAAVALALLVAGGAWWRIESGRLERASRVAGLVDEAGREMARLEGEARSADPTRALSVAREALAVARRTAAAASSQDADAPTLARAQALLDGAVAADVAARVRMDGIERDRAMVARIEEVIGQTLDERYVIVRKEPIPALWAHAFEAYLGVDLLSLAPEDAAERLRASAIRYDLTYALAHWSGQLPAKGEVRARVVAVLVAAEEDPWRLRLWRTDPSLEASAALAAATNPADRAPRDLLLLADRLLSAGDPAGARPWALEGWRRSPSDVWACWLSAMTYAQAKPPMVSEAAGFLQAARALRPQSALFPAALGILYREAVDHERGIPALRDAIRMQPNDSLLHVYLGELLRDQGVDDEAMAAFREGLRLGDHDASNYDNIGVLLLQHGDLDGAIATFAQGLERHPTNADLLNHTGAALDEKGEPEASLPWFRKAIESRPNDSTIHVNLGVALARLGRLDEAIAATREATRVDPTKAKCWVNLADLLRRKGDAAGALVAVREALRLETKDARTLYSIGNHLRDAGDADGAVSAFQAAIRLDPAYAEAYCNLGQLFKATAHFEEAVEMLRRGHEVGTARPQWPYRSDAWLAEAEEYLAADRALPAVLAGGERPSSPRGMRALAVVAGVRGHPGLSADVFESLDKAGGLAAKDAYNAACFAAIAGTGRADAGKAVDEASRRRLRALALRWLRQELERLRAEPPERQAQAAATLQHWTQDSDLAGVRDPEPLAGLSAEERSAWEALWRDVSEALERAGGAGR